MDVLAYPLLGVAIRPQRLVGSPERGFPMPLEGSKLTYRRFLYETKEKAHEGPRLPYRLTVGRQ